MEKEIEDLKKRIEELEKRPAYYPPIYWQPPPYSPYQVYPPSQTPQNICQRCGTQFYGVHACGGDFRATS